jgi:hypothetical protein
MIEPASESQQIRKKIRTANIAFLKRAILETWSQGQALNPFNSCLSVWSHFRHNAKKPEQAFSSILWTWRSADFADVEGGPVTADRSVFVDFVDVAICLCKGPPSYARVIWVRKPAAMEARAEAARIRKNALRKLREQEDRTKPAPLAIGASCAWTYKIQRSCSFRSGSRVERCAPGECAR